LDRFSVLAAELVGLRPDVIAAAVTPAAVATRALTKSIPIVFGLNIPLSVLVRVDEVIE
jgi:ABC-type uncharacterized transport system substrate-binding protein